MRNVPVSFKMDLTSILQATPARKVTTPAVAEEEEEWVSSTSSPGGSDDDCHQETKSADEDE